MKIQKIAVIGGGLMGRQIALCASINGFDATVYTWHLPFWKMWHSGRSTWQAVLQRAV